MFLAHAFNATGPRAWLLWLGLALLLVGALRIAGVARRHVPEWAGLVVIVAGVGAAVVGNIHTEPPDPSSRPVTPGRVQIVAPPDGYSVPGGHTTLDVDVEGFELVSASGKVARPGYGHVHVAVDGLVADMPTAIPDGGLVVCIPEGEHTISAVLVAEDHFGFRNEADVTDTVEVTADEGSC